MKKNYAVEVATINEACELRDRVCEKYGIDYSDTKAVVTSFGVRVIVRSAETISHFGFRME